MDKSKMTMKELREAGVSPEEAGQLFASRYDPTIQSLVGVLRMFGMGDEQYNGVYTVMDTGPAVQGRELDDFLAAVDLYVVNTDVCVLVDDV